MENPIKDHPAIKIILAVSAIVALYGLSRYIPKIRKPKEPVELVQK